MNRTRLAIVGVVVSALGILATMSLYIVRVTEQVLLLQFGEYVTTVQAPGLHFKLPWQEAIAYAKRVLSVDPEGEEMLLTDQKRVVVASFARYRADERRVGNECVRACSSGGLQYHQKQNSNRD